MTLLVLRRAHTHTIKQQPLPLWTRTTYLCNFNLQRRPRGLPGLFAITKKISVIRRNLAVRINPPPSPPRLLSTTHRRYPVMTPEKRLQRRSSQSVLPRQLTWWGTSPPDLVPGEKWAAALCAPSAHAWSHLQLPVLGRSWCPLRENTQTYRQISFFQLFFLVYALIEGVKV